MCRCRQLRGLFSEVLAGRFNFHVFSVDFDDSATSFRSSTAHTELNLSWNCEHDKGITIWHWAKIDRIEMCNQAVNYLKQRNNPKITEQLMRVIFTWLAWFPDTKKARLVIACLLFQGQDQLIRRYYKKSNGPNKGHQTQDGQAWIERVRMGSRRVWRANQGSKELFSFFLLLHTPTEPLFDLHLVVTCHGKEGD